MKKGLSMYFSKKNMAIGVGIITIASGIIYAGINQDVLKARDTYRKKTSTVQDIQQIAATTSPEELLAVYPQYWAALKAAETDDDLVAGAFLRQQTENSYLTERVRNQWLKSLAKRGQWSTFNQEFTKLDPKGTDQEVSCYQQINLINQGTSESIFIENIMKSDAKLPEGCNTLLGLAAQNNLIDSKLGWQRVRALLGKNQTTAARSLARSLGSPLPTQLGGSIGSGTQGEIEGALFAASNPEAIKKGTSISQLSRLGGNLNSEQEGFVWGKLGLAEAKKLNMSAALSYFNQADSAQLTNEQWEWWARAALRGQNWDSLARIIRNMPVDLQQSNPWQYWLARCYQVQGNLAAAQEIWQKISKTGRNYYAVLSTEELGGKVTAQSNVGKASNAAIRKVNSEPAIARALALFHASNTEGRAELREDARREWRFAMRNRSEDDLLAAAALAQQNGFLEMAIFSAEQTNEKLDYSLRYLSPYKDVTQSYADPLGLDTAWVYGLIRQESRFIIGARSTVGASGLMQIMPATAKWIAGKMGIGSYRIDDINTNIQMGTWYLDHVHDTLGHEVLATAGYNAGPGRARNWRANRPLEGTIYAETIPFNETRDYVQKVMTNSVYYASLFGQPHISLKQRMGTVPGK
ncbi:transglycosylase SLT domain-containing protein [Neisseria sp. Ec49-e6-T10]|uniref:lytic transglycosylase domain-containing protein n=1 Tax=Neisseria sp. Ec49-e6-T10 TaxID=3140744 RepID=UPI003EBA2D3E